jgi:hypothetical protein
MHNGMFVMQLAWHCTSGGAGLRGLDHTWSAAQQAIVDGDFEKDDQGDKILVNQPDLHSIAYAAKARCGSGIDI